LLAFHGYVTRLKGLLLVAACTVVGLACQGKKAIDEPGGGTGTGGTSGAGTGGTSGGGTGGTSGAGTGGASGTGGVGGTGTGGMSPSGTGGMPAVTGGSTGTGGTGGGAGSTTALPGCTGAWGYVGPGQATTKTIAWSVSGTQSGSDTQTLVLREPTANGWLVSQVGAPASTAPWELKDNGVLSGFNVGDEIKAILRQDCQPFSGCKTFSVFREATTDRLISAAFSHGPETLPAFAAVVGIPLSLEATCSFPAQTRCYVDEVQTYQRVVVGGDTQVRVDRNSSAPFAVGGLSYTAWLGAAVTNTGPSLATLGCVDAGALWASGAVHFAITR
jgi:hypothetical protein